jgi:hypothetical protein
MTKHDEDESWAYSMQTTKTMGVDHDVDTPGYHTLGWYINDILKHFKGENKEELIAALRNAALQVYNNHGLDLGQRESSNQLKRECSDKYKDRVEDGHVFCKEVVKDTDLTPQFQRMGKCKAHLGHDSYPFKYLRLILEEAHNLDLLVVPLETALAYAKEISPNSSKVYGQFILLLAMVDPSRVIVRIVRGRTTVAVQGTQDHGSAPPTLDRSPRVLVESTTLRQWFHYLPLPCVAAHVCGASYTEHAPLGVS